jgi:hypothetical protein
MAISVIAMASGTFASSYADEAAFLRELKTKVTGLGALPQVPAWVAEVLEASTAGDEH